MREIKFRAWDTEKNLMVEDINILLLDEYKAYPHSRKYIHDCTEWENYDLINKPVLMQFTGLKDKNGKEIYEGDIVRILYTDWISKTESDTRTLEQYKIDISEKGIVEFHECEFVLKISEYYGSIFEGRHGEKEVIGNIYQNPELLK